MKKYIQLFATACLTLFPLFSSAQEVNEKPHGEAIIKVFTNFHAGFGHNNDDRGFDLDRSYLGYQYHLADGLTIKAVMDIGTSKKVDDYQHIAYIKNAEIKWVKGNWTLNGGLISTTQFNLQEKHWGYRYISKSFQDEYKFGHSADLGVSVAYRFNDLVSADAIVTNGEGYKKLQVDNGLSYGIGATVYPIEGLTLRCYAGLNEATDKNLKDTWNYAAFAGYKYKWLSVGAEYNYMQHADGTKQHDLWGISLFGSVRLPKNIEIFARYNDISSRGHKLLDREERAAMGGAQFKLGKYVKLAPNFRITDSKKEGVATTYMAYLSCFFGL